MTNIVSLCSGSVTERMAVRHLVLLVLLSASTVRRTLADTNNSSWWSTPENTNVSNTSSTPTPSTTTTNTSATPLTPGPITCHILDTSLGRPAAGVTIRLSRGDEGGWTKVAERVTDRDGRVGGFLGQGQLVHGVYRIRFNTGDYFRNQKIETFYPYAEVVFEIKDPSQHFHIPLLLSPFGYTTYRGS